jgi:hypothetical protein
VWYNNHIALFRQGEEIKESQRKVKIKRWNGRSVARDKYGECYEDIKSEMIAAGVEWNELHRKTIAKLWEGLSEKEQEDCHKQAVSRNRGEINETDKRK